MATTSFQLVTHSELKKTIESDLIKHDISNQFNNFTYFYQPFLRSYEDQKDIYKVRLYVPDGLIYSDENNTIFNLTEAVKTDWYKRYAQVQKDHLWLPYQYFNTETSSSEIVAVIRPVIATDNYQKHIGVVRLDVLKENLVKILTNANTTRKNLVYLVHSLGEIIAESDASLINDFQINHNDVLQIAESKDQWSNLSYSGEKLLVGSRLISNSDWYMVSVIPVSEISYESRTVRNQMLVLMLVIATFAYIMVYFISNSMTKRTSRLVNTMKEVRNGMVKKISSNHGTDEIGEVTESYNFMVDRISALMAEQYRLGQNLKNAELKALQAQINPHFLYNTLDTINQLATLDMVGEINAVVHALSRFYRLSLSKGDDVISIQDEVNLVSYYVSIQNMRFNNRIEYVVEIDEKILEFDIPKITLQPLVENAILHGLLGSKDKGGRITIKGRFEKDVILLTVEDNGVGISDESIISLLCGTINSKTGSGYGIRNINERIKLYYGEGYGAKIQSKLGEGTSVEIRIPPFKGGHDLSFSQNNISAR